MHALLAQLKSSNISLPCPAVRCCVVLRCAFLRTYSSTAYDAKYQVPGTVMHIHTYVLCSCLFYFFIQLIVIFRSPYMHVPPPRKQHPYYCRSERDIANKHTAQYTAQGN